MKTPMHISLVDRDVRRRAAIAHCLTGAGISAAPLESADELIARWPSGGIVLTHDDTAGDDIAGNRGGDRGTGTLGELMHHIGRSGSWLPIVAYAEKPDPAQVVDAVLEGAIAYLSWPFGLAELTDAITAVETRAERLGGAKLREAMARSRIDRLTRREREVLRGVASGLSNRKIGETLAISPRTVEIHRANMLTKMGANHTSEAIRLAIEASLIA